ncbi:MAG: hypothetical protein JRI79_07920 [Deltaproteobacteria bacterium]|nr:hypothetical protein [Deltaproteobacteria bacterium]MBW1977882.1 hypothetical protein [Deltaproteobacteria bacterium]MBW2045289.1 hypothetical protein [Deltaproteobacteria bacterium]MBW2301425.1 hypothetical protein [Deltaproteobacteria bacterium]
MPDVALLMKTKDALREEIDRAEREALDSFFRNIPSDSVPTEENIRAASAHAWQVLKKRLFSPDVSRKLGIPDFKIGELTLYVNEIIRPDSIPLPPFSSEFSAIRLGIAAAAGALIGMLLLEPITRYLLGLPGAGKVIGSLLGSLALVFLCVGPLQKNAVRYGVWGAALGSEFGAMVSFVKGKMSGKWLKKMLMSPLITLVVMYLSKKEKIIDRDKYSQDIKQIISGWSATVVAALALSQEHAEEKRDRVDPVMGHLSAKIVELHSTQLDDLPLTAYELIQEARNVGFGGLEGEPLFIKKRKRKEDPTFTWSEEMAKQYDTYGYVSIGDQVKIVKRPVILHGKIMKKGLVRKERSK